MSEDIVDKLMDYDRCDPDAVMDEAAEVIVALRADVKELSSALEDALASAQMFRDRLFQYRMLSAECQRLCDEWIDGDGK